MFSIINHVVPKTITLALYMYKYNNLSSETYMRWSYAWHGAGGGHGDGGPVMATTAGPQNRL